MRPKSETIKNNSNDVLKGSRGVPEMGIRGSRSRVVLFSKYFFYIKSNTGRGRILDQRIK